MLYIKMENEKMIFKVYYHCKERYGTPEAIVGEFTFDCLDDLMKYFDDNGYSVLYAKEVVGSDEMSEFKEKIS